MDRFVQFAVAASTAGVKDADLNIGDEVDAERVGVMIGSGIGGLGTWEDQHNILLEKGPKRVSPFFIPMMIANMASGQVSMHRRKRPEQYSGHRLRDGNAFHRRCLQADSARRCRCDDLRRRGSDDPSDGLGRLLLHARDVDAQRRA